MNVTIRTCYNTNMLQHERVTTRKRYMNTLQHECYINMLQHVPVTIWTCYNTNMSQHKQVTTWICHNINMLQHESLIRSHVMKKFYVSVELPSVTRREISTKLIALDLMALLRRTSTRSTALDSTASWRKTSMKSIARVSEVLSKEMRPNCSLVATIRTTNKDKETHPETSVARSSLGGHQGGRSLNCKYFSLGEKIKSCTLKSGLYCAKQQII